MCLDEVISPQTGLPLGQGCSARGNMAMSGEALSQRNGQMPRLGLLRALGAAGPTAAVQTGLAWGAPPPLWAGGECLVGGRCCSSGLDHVIEARLSFKPGAAPSVCTITVQSSCQQKI